jgi:hypothetical protein
MKDDAGMFAQETLPTLQHHLAMAQALEKTSGNTVGFGNAK